MKLRGESAAFELSYYDIDVKVGHLTLRLTAYNGDVPAIIVAEHLFANQAAAEELGVPAYGGEVQTVNEIAPAGAVLKLGEVVRIGRRNLVEIIDRQGNVDAPRKDLYDWRPFEKLVDTDRAISRDHLAISSLGGWVAEVRDLGSLNGTTVNKVEITE